MNKVYLECRTAKPNFYEFCKFQIINIISEQQKHKEARFHQKHGKMNTAFYLSSIHISLNIAHIMKASVGQNFLLILEAPLDFG